MVLILTYKDGTIEHIEDVNEVTTWLQSDNQAGPELIIHFVTYVTGPRYVPLKNIVRITSLTPSNPL